LINKYPTTAVLSYNQDFGVHVQLQNLFISSAQTFIFLLSGYKLITMHKAGFNDHNIFMYKFFSAVMLLTETEESRQQKVCHQHQLD